MTTLFGNFTISEVSKSSTAIRMEIDNTPSEQVLHAARLLAEHCLQPIRDHYSFPFSPQSWYRCEALEKVICYKSFPAWLSKHHLDHIDPQNWRNYFNLKSHPKGEAADIEIIGISNDELYNWCKDNLHYDQLIREFAKPSDPQSGWVHISYREYNNRQQAFKI